MSEKGNMPSELAEQEKVKRPVVKKKANELMAGVVEVASVTGKKSIEVVSNVISQTASGSKVLASEIAKGAKDISEKAKEDSYKRRLKKYNPLFVEEYNSPDFFVPNIICIVDDAVRRDIDVCQGAIGWREKKKGTEVLFLYDEFVNQSGLDFVPMPVCDEVYYVDSFEKKRYIKLDCVFQQAHEEKLAELEYIAYSLGAKSCTVQIEENEVKHDKKAKRAGIKENLSVEMQTIATKDESAEIESVNDRVRVNYYDEKYVTEWPMYHYEILNAKNKHNRRLTLWVGYDLGGTNYDTGEEEKRGYYLYFTNCFKRNISGRKILLLEVNKKTKASLEKAVEMACLYGKVIVSNYYYKLEINWDKPIYERYGFMSPWMNVPKVRCFRSIKNCILE